MTAPTPSDSPSIGRIVIYRITEDRIVPAIIVAVWGLSFCNLRLLLDGSNSLDAVERAKAASKPYSIGHDPADPTWVTSRDWGEGVGQWSWPPSAA
jgi:hypothetical protein